MSEKICGIVLYKRSEKKHHGETLYSGCNKWDCPVCAEAKKRRLMARVITGMNADNRQWYFVTLTAPPYCTDFQSSLKAFKAGYRKVYQAMKNAIKSYGLKGDFLTCKIFEKHKDGRLHVHIITDINFQSRRRRKSDKGKKNKPYIFVDVYRVKRRGKRGGYYYRSSFLADISARSGLGYIGECRPIKTKGEKQSGAVVASYIAKYVGKSTSNTDDKNDWPRYAHRVEFSANWPPLPPLENDGLYEYLLAKRPIIISDKLSGYHVEDKAGYLRQFASGRLNDENRPE